MHISRKILVSACLSGECCRYDGGRCTDERLLEVLKEVEWIPVCPERLGGLPTPREPAEIIGGDGREVLSGQAVVRTENGMDVSAQFIGGAQKTLEIARREGIKKAILKQKSPSCGCGSIYDGSFSGKLIKGDGITAILLKQSGIICISSDNIIVPGFF